MSSGFGLLHRCCLTSGTEACSFCTGVYGVEMKGIVTGDEVVALCCMLDQSYIMQLNNYLLNIVMNCLLLVRVEFLYSLFLFLSPCRICPFSLEQPQVALLHVIIAPVFGISLYQV